MSVSRLCPYKGRERAFGRRARPSGRPAHFAGVSQCRWRVSAPAGRSSLDPAGGAVAPGAEASLRTHRRRTSAATARREHAPLRRALPLTELRELGYIYITRRMQRIAGERERGTVHGAGGRIHLLPPEINWAHRMLSASSLLCWSCTHWLKCVASVISDVPLMAYG